MAISVDNPIFTAYILHTHHIGYIYAIYTPLHAYATHL